MTVAFWCVLVAGFMPYLMAIIAKRGGARYDNRDPRGWLAQQEGWRKRANSAQLNCFEAFPLFAAGVIIAHIVNGPQALVDTLALVFIGLRMVYLVLYLANKSTYRSLTWFTAFGTTLAIYFVAAG